MREPRASSLSELARIGFESLSETNAKLELLDSLMPNGITPESFGEAASADRALDSLIELARIDPKASAQVVSNPLSAERLIRVLGASDGLAGFMQRHPGALNSFSRPISLPSTSELESLSERSSVSDMRASYRKLLLQIADYDLSQAGFESVALVTAALTKLAEGAISAGLKIARQQLIDEGRYSPDAISQTKISVIAMGKCGAQELNYLSDVDVIYVASGDSEKYLDIATKIATKLAQVIDGPDKEPGLWQLDPNLRPEGKQGALVRSLEGHLSYYERWAESWEFQALLKARFIAGDSELGQEYISRIKPLIWSKPERASIVESARHLRKRVLDLIPAQDRDVEIKLGRGGLRDIEFTAQLLQLVHGVSDESLRVMNTFDALKALTDAGLLSRSDRDVFVEAYGFLRTLEHRVQLMKLRRTHLLPRDESEFRRVARAMRLTPQELSKRWEETRSLVAQLHDSVFYRPLLQATAALSPGEVVLSDEDVLVRLRALGFRDPKGASQHLTALTQGVSRRAIIQRTLLPVLIRWMAEGTDPDRALISFRRLSEDLGETHWFLGMLRDSSGAAERLMRVLSSSALISRLLEHSPESTHWFGDEDALRPRPGSAIEAELQAIIDRHRGEAAEPVRNVRRREYLRVAIGAVLGASTYQEISAGLTAITESYLRAMLAVARLRTGIEVDFCIVAMGRLGGSELGFGSDADAMFLFDSELESGQVDAERLSSELLGLVKDSLLEFEVDLGLRPEGKNGPRVRSLNGYRGYYQSWADAWEYQALLRARPLSGSESITEKFLELIDPYRYPADLAPKALLEIRRIKARVESERLPQGADPARHLKLGRGSLSDVEWLAQLYQLKHAHQYPELRTTQTIPALESLAKLGLIDQESAHTLIEAWLISARARSALVLAVDKLVDVLPTDVRILESLSRILEYQAGEAAILEQDYLSATRRARAVFERLFLG